MEHHGKSRGFKAGECEQVIELLRILLSSVTNESLALDRFFKTNKKCMILVIIYFIYFSVTNRKDAQEHHSKLPQKITRNKYQKKFTL